MRTCILICAICIVACPQADARWLDGAGTLVVSPESRASGIAAAHAQTAAWIGPAIARGVLAVLVSPPPFRYHYVTPGISLTGQHPTPRRYHYVTRGVFLT